MEYVGIDIPKDKLDSLWLRDRKSEKIKTKKYIVIRHLSIAYSVSDYAITLVRPPMTFRSSWNQLEFSMKS
jgi:hypothetical protein